MAVCVSVPLVPVTVSVAFPVGVLAPVETVNVDQSVLGRILGYGTIHVLGTGQGIEGLSRMARPIAVRNAITAR